MIRLVLLTEAVKFIVYSLAIVLISKYILVTTIRKLAENLNLRAKAVGDVAGYATSVPELLTVSASSINGLIGASIYNILSSNIINFFQYISSIIINKNQKAFRNQAVRVDIFLVLLTILLPFIFIVANIEMDIFTVVIFVILYIAFKYINNNAHKLYLNTNQEEIVERKHYAWYKSIKYILLLILTGVLLFVVGNLLGTTLENLCYSFGVPEIVIGILLGIITSIPELITFIESQKHHKKENDELSGIVEATNNLFTSNILNLFIIQSIGVLIYVLIA